MNIIDEIKRCRNVGAPLLAVETADQLALIEAVRAGFNAEIPLLSWDIARGFDPLNEAGKAAYDATLNTAETDETRLVQLPDAFNFMLQLPAKSLVLVMNGHRYIEMDDPVPVQAVMNLREPYKKTRRTLVLTGPGFKLPPELVQDVLVLEEALPTESEVKEILSKLWAGAKVKADDETLTRATDALRGLAVFPVEQAGALALRKVDGKLTVDIADLWERKRRMINQTPGLTMEQPRETFDQVGGLAQIKKMITRKFKGRRPPRCVVFMDEMDKMFGGLGVNGAGDSSGTTQDAFGVFLSAMEDWKHSGKGCVGPAGSGKSFIARAIAATFGCPLFKLDIGGTKDSKVGSSEQRIRAAMKTINAIAGLRGAFFIFTANRLNSLPPEVLRRFRFGIYFYDLCDESERRSVARLTAKHPDYDGVIDAGEAEQFFADRDGWSAANIRDCIEMSYDMDCPLEEAAEGIVPAASQSAKAIKELRQMANGVFLSASKPGKYTMPNSSSIPSPESMMSRVIVTDEAEQERGN